MATVEEPIVVRSDLQPETARAGPRLPRPRADSGSRTGPGWRRLRIVMIGQKGLPATHGGIEHHVEEISARLAAAGHDVTVFCRASYNAGGLSTYRGVRLRRVRTIGTKHLDAIVHSAYSTLAAVPARPDIVHYHGLGPGLLAPVPRYLSASKVVLTVHGLDHERAKWGRTARYVLTGGHWVSGHVPDECVVVSRHLAEHYDTRFSRAVRLIPNGVVAPQPRPASLITERFGLRAGSYALFVGRLVPEKAIDLLISAYARVPGDRRLVIVGDSSFTDEYVARVRALAAADDRVIFTGFAYGDLLCELYSNAAVFVQPSRLEGMPLTVLEAAAFGLPIVASDIPPHVELLGAAVAGRRLFRDGDGDDLARQLSSVLGDIEAEHAGARRLRELVLDDYSWDAAAQALEQLYLEISARRLPTQP